MVKNGSAGRERVKMVMVTRTTAAGRPERFSEKDKDRIVTEFNDGATIRGLVRKYRSSKPTILRILHERGYRYESGKAN